ncbi:MAG: hypothetical protein HON47_04565 [Candidatus Diapherotrites archaeon]|mgnify:CR=1 FL=1|jgi:hypothetical protein|uniref:Uncharacterized protein n=1 Tax=Candidatus Iainarchaeum sp. TaxID=3101447 RepID=A0A8T5GG03_9ARCH|nr:hypothetical protein [Candidatus Diapherotrites archaeon]MBT7241728.1 hypothetical protein [Candidatus Diapherotrites archaeon]
MSRPIKISEKTPYTISSSKKGLTVGKWAVSHLLPKKSFLEEDFYRTKKMMKKTTREWQKIKKEHLEHTPQGREVLTIFYRQAALYSEMYWKLCQQKIRLGKGNKSKLRSEMDQAKKDFNYFWEEHRKYKGVNEKSTNYLEEQLDRLRTRLEKSRGEVHTAEREYGEKSWHVRKALVTHLETLNQYLKRESEHMRSLMQQFPEHKDILDPQIERVEEEFKKTTKRIQIVKDSL